MHHSFVAILVTTITLTSLTLACADTTPPFSPEDAATFIEDAGTTTVEDAATALRDAATPDGALTRNVDAARPMDAGRTETSACMDRCFARARSCAAPADVATTECARLCDAEPTEAQLDCTERASCAALTCGHGETFPCGIGTTESIALDRCMEVCVATAERCSAPTDVAEDRCAATCLLVTDGAQLTCLRDASCDMLTCLDAEATLPCGIGPS